MHGGNQRSHIFKQTCIFLHLKVPGLLKCVRPFVTTRHYGIKKENRMCNFFLRYIRYYPSLDQREIYDKAFLSKLYSSVKVKSIQLETEYYIKMLMIKQNLFSSTCLKCFEYMSSKRTFTCSKSKIY